MYTTNVFELEKHLKVLTNLNKQNMKEKNKTQRDSDWSAPSCSADENPEETGLDGEQDPVESALVNLHKAIRPIACHYEEKRGYRHDSLSRGTTLEIYHTAINLLDRYYPTARKSEPEHPLGWVRKEKQLFGMG